VPEFSTIAAGKAVRQCDLPRSWKQVLRALVDYSDGEGVCWPSRWRLSRDIGVSPRTVQRTMAELKRSGLVVVIGWRCRGQLVEAAEEPVAIGRGYIPVYRVCLQRLAAVAAELAAERAQEPTAPGPPPAPAPEAAPADVPVPAPEAAPLPEEPVSPFLPFIPSDEFEEFESSPAEVPQELFEYPVYEYPDQSEPEVPAPAAAPAPPGPTVQLLLPGLQPEVPVPSASGPAAAPEAAPPGPAAVPAPAPVPRVKRRPKSSSTTTVRTIVAFVPPALAELEAAAAELVAAAEREGECSPGVLRSRIIAAKFAEFLQEQRREPTGGWRHRLYRWVLEDAARAPRSAVAQERAQEPTAAERARVEELWSRLRICIRSASNFKQLREALHHPDNGGADGPLAVAFEGADWIAWQQVPQRSAVESRVCARLLAEVRLAPAAAPSGPAPEAAPGPTSSGRKRSVVSVAAGGH
jgi:hypothetical protein